jgi:uncharacterized protein (DUF427 family)
MRVIYATATLLLLLATCVIGDHVFEASWHRNVIARAMVKDVKVVDGLYFFPETSLKREFFYPSKKQTKDKYGTAFYYTLKERHPDHGTHVKEDKHTAFSYRNPKDDFKHIKGMVAFHGGVTIQHVEVGDHHRGKDEL